MFVNLQLVVFMRYARFLLSHKADAISGRSRPWAKLGGGGFLQLTLPPFLPSAILSFFFFTQNKGVGGGGNWPPGPNPPPPPPPPPPQLTPGSLPSIHYCTYYEHHIREGMNVGNLNHALRLWTFPPVSKNIPFGSSLAYHNQKKKSVQSSSSSFEDTGGVLFDR